MKRSLSLTMAMVVAGAVTPTNAALVYDLALRAPAQSGSADERIVAKPGEVISNVKLLLIETVSADTASILGDDEDVVGAGGIRNRAGNLASYRANLSVSGSNGSFSGLSANLTGGAAQAGRNDADTLAYLSLGNFFTQPGLQASVVDANTRELVLGTVDLRAPTSGASTFLRSCFGPRPRMRNWSSTVWAKRFLLTSKIIRVPGSRRGAAPERSIQICSPLSSSAVRAKYRRPRAPASDLAFTNVG